MVGTEVDICHGTMGIHAIVWAHCISCLSCAYANNLKLLPATTSSRKRWVCTICADLALGTSKKIGMWCSMARVQSRCTWVVAKILVNHCVVVQHYLGSSATNQNQTTLGFDHWSPWQIITFKAKMKVGFTFLRLESFKTYQDIDFQMMAWPVGM